MKLLNLLALGLFVITLFVACSSPVEGVSVLPCKEFEEKFIGEREPQLIDVRTPEEFAGGTIMAAVNIDYNGENFKAEMDKLDKNRPVYVFCAKGGRSASASAICKEIGFKEIYDLEGGYTAWTAYKK